MPGPAIWNLPLSLMGHLYEMVYLELLFIYLTAALGPLGWVN